MDEIILANVDWLIARNGGYVDEFGDVRDCEGNVLATHLELATPGLTPATAS